MKIETEMQERLISEELSYRFKQYRINYPMTMAELSEKSNVSIGTIVRFENGNDIGFLNLIKLIKALELSSNFDQLIPEPNVIPSAQTEVRPMLKVKKNNISTKN
jgi:transcriptional regulator with XRE-family HTH domain